MVEFEVVAIIALDELAPLGMFSLRGTISFEPKNLAESLCSGWRSSKRTEVFLLNRWTIVFLAALVAGLIAIPLLPMGLVLPELILFPVTLTISALASAIAAGWTANRVAKDGTRTDLGRTVGATASIGLGLAIALLLLKSSPLGVFPILVPFGIALIVLAATASVVTRRFRTDRDEPKKTKPVLLTAALIVFGILLIPITLMSISAISQNIRSAKPIQISSGEASWCESHVVEVLLEAQRNGFGLDESKNVGAPDVERIGNEVRYDSDAFENWRSKLPNEYALSCREAAAKNRYEQRGGRLEGERP